MQCFPNTSRTYLVNNYFPFLICIISFFSLPFSPLCPSLSCDCEKNTMLMHQQKPFFFFLLLSFTIWSLGTLEVVVSDPQTVLVTVGCSLVNVSDVSIFRDNLNATFRSMRNQINNQSKHFATESTVKGNNPAYGLFQCRDYLSIADCLACFDVAETKVRRNCTAASNGAHAIYEGCFLRYELSTLTFLSVYYIIRHHC